MYLITTSIDGQPLRHLSDIPQTHAVVQRLDATRLMFHLSLAYATQNAPLAAELAPDMQCPRAERRWRLSGCFDNPSDALAHRDQLIFAEKDLPHVRILSCESMALPG